jgi:hypothetical protein
VKIELEALDVAENPPKRARTAQQRKTQRELKHEAALREISPEYYFSPNPRKIFETGTKTIRGPSYLTRKDFPVGGDYGREPLLWTGKAVWKNRTYVYEAKNDSGEIVYFKQKELKLQKNNRNVKRIDNTRVRRSTQMTSLLNIFE